MIFLLLGKKLLHKIYLPLLLTLFIANIIFSKIYYNYFFAPYASVLDSYNTTFGIFKILPSTLIVYLILRKIFILLTGEEPKIVGKYALFSDTGNWLFTVITLIVGIALPYLIPWF